MSHIEDSGRWAGGGRLRTRVSRGTLEHRAMRISLVTGLSTVSAILFQVISVPLCLKYWGKESYGAWLALYASCLLVRSLDSGFVSYVGNELNCLYHKDQDAFRQHLASSVVGVTVIGCVELAIGMAAFFFEGVSSSLFVSSHHGNDLRAGAALLVLVGSWALSGPYMGVLSRLLIPSGLMYESAWWSMGFQISQAVAIILAAALKFDLPRTALLLAFLQMSIHFGTGIYIRRALPQYYPWWQGCKPQTGIRDLRRSMLLTVSNIVQQGSTSGVILLISALAGAATVPIFVTVRTMANLWSNVTNVLTTPLLPDVVRYHAKGEGRKLVSICDAYWVLVGSAVNLGVLIAFPLVEPMYGYWTTHAMALDKSLLCLLLASVVVANVGGLITMFLNGINSLGVVLLASLVRGTLSVVGGGCLFFYVGLSGFGLAILGGELLALLILGRHFVSCELPRQAGHLAVLSIAPVTVSSASVVIFLMVEGFGLSLAQYLYPVSMLGVAIAALWGWRRLAPDVKDRCRRMISDRVV